MPFQARQDQPRGRQDKVQRLSIPFKIIGNATAASVVLSSDEPTLLFLKTAGVDQITTALAAADTAPTYAAPVDAAGTFNILVIIGEKVKQVVSATVVSRNSTQIVPASLTTVPSTGIVAGGALDKIALNCTSGLSAAAANTLDACLIVEYITAS